MLGISTKNPIARILVDRSVLKEPLSLICKAVSRHNFNVDLDALTGTGHLFIGLWLALFLCRLFLDKTFPTHTAKQTFNSAGISSFLQSLPQLGKPQLGIPVSHITNKFEFFLCVLPRMAVRPSGLTGKGFYCPIPATTPEVDVGASFVVFAACSADTILLCVLHQGLPILHVLCYTIAHEGCDSFLVCWVW